MVYERLMPDRAALAGKGRASHHLGSPPLRLKASLNATRCPSASVSTSTCCTGTCQRTTYAELVQNTWGRAAGACTRRAET